MQQREGHATGIKGLARQVQQHRGILADRIEHDRALELGGHFAEDVDRFVLECLQMRIERRLGALRIVQFRFRMDMGHFSLREDLSSDERASLRRRCSNSG
ncbi:hypothetical protein D9M70_578760 [compost metagenome]